MNLRESTSLALGLILVASSTGQSLSRDQVGKIDGYVKREIARQRIPGVEIGIYVNGHAVLAKGYGLSNVELQTPVLPVTMMQSGSTGKQFAATAVMMLVEQGKVGLEDPITKYFPDAPATWAPIKVKNLLSHTSGLAEYESDELAKPGGEFDLRLDFTEDELVHKIEKLPIEFAPGDKWDYRNTNYVLLGALIRRVTGKFYGDFLHEKIFAPLGMTATRIISDHDIVPNRSAGYLIEEGRLKNQTYVSPTFNSTADGAMYYNVIDLEKWDRALYGASLLTAASLKKMWTPFVLNSGKPNDSGYGFAWEVADVNGHRVVEHNGAWQGFTCVISRYIDDKVTVVVLTNLDAAHSSPESIERVVAGLVKLSLMPKLSKPITDTKPEIASVLKQVMLETIAGRNAAGFYTADAGYKFDPNDAADMLSSLPKDWHRAPVVLMRRKETGGLTTSRFRVGPSGDTRSVIVQTDAHNKVHLVLVRADPDNR